MLKNKFLTALLSLLMIIPLAGCGKQNMSKNPKENETKILINFTESNGTSYENDSSKHAIYYPDCADVYGEGFYKIGETATISIDYDKKDKNHFLKIYVIPLTCHIFRVALT